MPVCGEVFTMILYLYRGTYGGCFSTTLGALVHELGHSLDLGHTENGIMARGFDDMDRFFSICPNKISFHGWASFMKTTTKSVSIKDPIMAVSGKSQESIDIFS